MRVSGSGAAVLLFFGLVSWSRGQETIKKLSGSNVTFKVDVTAGPTEIAWYQRTDKIVDLEVGSEPFFYSLKNRTVPDLSKGTLLLMDVSPADSGSYRAQLLIGGSYKNVYFSLQVFDRVCQVVIRNSTQENNVTLWCTCSAPSAAPPTRYQWSNESSRSVSDLQKITVQRADKEQLLRCNASNEVSWTDATITVPAKANNGRSHIAAIICAIVGVIIIIIAIILLYFRCRKRATFSVQNQEDTVKLLQEPTGESLTPSEIVFKKDGEVVMSILLQSPVLCLERLSVQPHLLKIMDVKEEDFAQYKAKVHLGENTTTHTFLCKSAQNGKIGEDDDPETGLVYPENGELTMEIPNAENAERIVWSKDGAEILAVTCSPLSSERPVLYKGALSTDLVWDGDKTHWDDVARPPGASVEYIFCLNDAARNSGSITLYPVIVENEERITWTKDGKRLASCKAGESPEYSRGGAFYLKSGRLTLSNLKEDCSGQYIMEAQGPKTSRQEFSLTICPAF
ncbi:uncharacterized protein LOC122930735 [Bufo gargarizans]|uniref:uncharacterized protein LOC122930735 n=1 Tax=Bufo gargarizans TaxID=30331 RepID=UPI001CF46C77|nr:uncharacterized protein LOC122930735 [Bufo gargarizans]